MWNLACPDWETRLRAGRSLVPDLPLFREEADLATAFFDNLRLPDVPDVPMVMGSAVVSSHRPALVLPPVTLTSVPFAQSYSPSKSTACVR